MDRQIVFLGQVPEDTDILLTNLHPYISIAKLAAAVLGTGTQLNAFTCVPTSPTSLNVQVTPGEIYALEQIDTTAYGSLPTDSTVILKQGISLAKTANLPCPAPLTTSNSINYLIQIGFAESDSGSVVLPYYNSANPTQAFAGPNNSGTPNFTIRQDRPNITVKAGTAAPTGTQTTPSPDSGFVGAFVVTVAQGQTVITSGNISTYPGAPFIQANLGSGLATQVGVQVSTYNSSTDTGSANAYIATLSPAPSSYIAGLNFKLKILNNNTAASTVNVNSLGAKNIKTKNGLDPIAGMLTAGMEAEFFYDGTNMQLMNEFGASAQQNCSYFYAPDTGSANSYVLTVTPTPNVAGYVAGQRFLTKIVNANTGASTININGIGAVAIHNLDGSALISGQLPAGCMAMFACDGTNFQLLNTFLTSFTNPQTFTSSGTYTPTTGIVGAMVEILAGGGGGGGFLGSGSFSGASGGGGAGNYIRVFLTAAQIGSSVGITIGAAGAAGASGNNAGGNGGNTTFGAASGNITANGGVGGTGSTTSSVQSSVAGGAGGAASGTTSGTIIINQAGSKGGFGYGAASTAICISGAGASTSLGQGGISSNTVQGIGQAGVGYGVGGSGACGTTSSAAGAAGTAGIIIITEFINK